MNRSSLLVVAATLSALVGACSHSKGAFVPGTRIPFSQPNKAVLDTAEEYRLAVERADTEALMMMAHKQYWEDSGTPSGSDDYGYDGLRTVLETRLPKATDIRYSVRYLAVRQSCSGDLVAGCRAAVDIMIDASFSIANAFGKTTRPDKRDQNQLVLEWDGRRWLFLSGM
ncbi:MAG: hypothetical protein H0T79_03550 [Deltaproteobacteria bacterium]|nr:hypothetical protein [Deltaproteobacteria bacterium]